VTVNDTAGHQVNATTGLNVTSGFGPAPKIISFTAWPSPGAVGKITHLTVDAVSQSGTPTELLSYAYLGLPPGCGTFNQTNLSCLPSEPGTYTITARVTDGYAQANYSSLTLLITGNASTPSNSSHGSLFGSTTGYIVIAVVVVLAAVAVVVYTRFVRKPPPKSGPIEEYPVTSGIPVQSGEGSSGPPSGSS
jgi:hypothetical protein